MPERRCRVASPYWSLANRGGARITRCSVFSLPPLAWQQVPRFRNGPSGVRVNAVSPGPTRTEGTDAMGKDLDELAAQAPAGRPASADEIAEAVVFLATDRASFIYGAKLAVDGGRTAI